MSLSPSDVTQWDKWWITYTEIKTFLQALRKGTALSWRDNDKSLEFQKPTNSGVRLGQSLDTRESLTTLNCMSMKGAILIKEGSQRPFLWSSVELCSAITSQNFLGAIMTDEPLEWWDNLYAWILYESYENIPKHWLPRRLGKLSPKGVQVNTSLPQRWIFIPGTILDEGLLVKLKDDWNTGNLKRVRQWELMLKRLRPNKHIC